MDDNRTLAQFFFEVGYSSCFAEAMVRNDCKPPFPLTDDMIERAWEISPECHDGDQVFAERLALANSAAELLEVCRAALLAIDPDKDVGGLVSWGLRTAIAKAQAASPTQERAA